MTHILIPREPSTALLRPFIGCNTQELHEAWAAMIRIAEVQHARAGSQCLAQIEEPAQPVAEICSASHDDAEFGERAIKPLCDISGFEYGTPLYAGAAPAAGAPRARDLLGIVRTAQSEARRLINGEDSGSDLAQTKLDLPETLRVLEHALSQPAAVAAPALEAPAAPATSAQVQALHRARRALHAIGKTYDDSELRTRALEADEEIDRVLAAAPEAPNCTRCSGSGEDPEGFLTHGRGPDDHTVDGPCRECDGTGAAPQAPAAPAVDADGARYRYLRDEHIGDDPESINLPPGKKRGLDSAVDAAIAAQAKEGGA